jgi:hypothetical protein
MKSPPMMLFRQNPKTDPMSAVSKMQSLLFIPKRSKVQARKTDEIRAFRWSGIVLTVGHT